MATNLPIGAGLSSSAAFEVAIALALGHAADWTTDIRSLARACQQAEHDATGVPCGIQDQLVALAGVADHALVIDCRDLAIEALPLPEGVTVLVVHSGVPRTLAGSKWAERRAETCGRRRNSSVSASCATSIRPRSPTIRARGTSSSEIERVNTFAEALSARRRRRRSAG